MNHDGLLQTLSRAEAAVERGDGLSGTGFWRMVNQVRGDAALSRQFGGRIASIDRRAFEAGVRLRVPAAVGTGALAAGAGAGVLALSLASGIPSRFMRSLVFLASFGVLEVTTHSLAHWAVGRAMGMRFTHYFLGGPPPPRPGAKVDYASYLSVPPSRRAVMHASGAVVTKVLPFALIPVARELDLASWTVYLLAAAGIGQVITDVLFSTKTSDWKKVRRELEASRRWRASTG